jgi:hypothetical protein
MGFALWLENDLAWAQGTHEYRPMGAAIIGARTLFSARDFRPSRIAPARDHHSYIGLFASIGEMNDYLRRSRSRQIRKNLMRRVPSTFRVI